MIGETRAIETTVEPVRGAPRLRVRAFVYVFLAAFLVCGALEVEYWPLTGFRLYTEIRTEERLSTRVIALLADGGSREVVFVDLPFGYHSTNRLISDFDELSQEERDEICDAWVRPLREDGVDVVGVRIDEYVTHLGDPASRPERVSELYRCGTP
jgi:hypothetical protein